MITTTVASTKPGRSIIRQLVGLQWDGSDLWGSSTGVLFGLCDVLHAYGYDVPEEAEYVASPLLQGPESLSGDWPDMEIAEFLVSKWLTPGDLQYWVRVLARYTDIIHDQYAY